jgi:sarcosine oxidase subunit gamma
LIQKGSVFVLDFSFTPQSPLEGFQKNFDGVSVSEVVNRAIISIATPLDGETALTDALSSAYGVEVPKVGHSTTSDVKNSRFLGLQQGMMFHVFDCKLANALQSIDARLTACAYLTDQSDSWVMLTIAGSNSRKALLRICSVNLHPEAFPEGRVVRALMEHLGVTIYRDGSDSFVLLAPRSSADSLLHAIVTSIENVTAIQVEE